MPARRLTFVILGGRIMFICMYERKERNQWPFGPWNTLEEPKQKKKKNN
jgi:prolipoprotein diacylglyceryltransferase